MAQKSTLIAVRLKGRELAALDWICKSANGDRNRSEIVRLLILREYRRRTTGKSVVKSSEISSDFRTGRPVDHE